MLAILGNVVETGHESIWSNPLLDIILVIAIIVIFIKFCGWSRKFTLSGTVKKVIFVLTVVAAVLFNVMYAKGNTQIEHTGSWQIATYAVVGSIIWVFIFAFALMSQSKSK